MGYDAEKLDKLDVKPDTNFMKWLKRIAYITTILTTISGGTLGILSYIREVKDPRAQSGYDEHSRMLKENSENIRENREEIRFIYRTLVSGNTGRAVRLPRAPVQRPLDWKQLPLRK